MRKFVAGVFILIALVFLILFNSEKTASYCDWNYDVDCPGYTPIDPLDPVPAANEGRLCYRSATVSGGPSFQVTLTDPIECSSQEALSNLWLLAANGPTGDSSLLSLEAGGNGCGGRGGGWERLDGPRQSSFGNEPMSLMLCGFRGGEGVVNQATVVTSYSSCNYASTGPGCSGTGLTDTTEHGGFCSWGANRRYSLCVGIPVSSTPGGPGSSLCNSNGFCDSGESADVCSDCRPCNDPTRDSSVKCQGSEWTRGYEPMNTQCYWCPKPTANQVIINPRKQFTSLGYPYLLPQGSYSNMNDVSFGCVNISAGDPFNCGGCGYLDDLSTAGTANLATSHLCRGTSREIKPYCKNTDPLTGAWSCVGTEERANPGSSPWFQQYSKSGANPYYYYSVSGSFATGYSSSSLNGTANFSFTNTPSSGTAASQQCYSEASISASGTDIRVALSSPVQCSSDSSLVDLYLDYSQSGSSSDDEDDGEGDGFVRGGGRTDVVRSTGFRCTSLGEGWRRLQMLSGPSSSIPEILTLCGKSSGTGSIISNASVQSSTLASSSGPACHLGAKKGSFYIPDAGRSYSLCAVSSSRTSSSPSPGSSNSSSTISSSTSSNVVNSTQAVFPSGAMDDSSEICALIAGNSSNFSSTYGCCGGGKVRYPGGELCNAQALCDGRKWHDVVDGLGEVFKLDPIFRVPYPIASVDGMLSLCVDEAHFDSFSATRINSISDEKSFCIPYGVDFNKSSCVANDYQNCSPNVGDRSRGYDLDYLCSSGWFYAGGNHVINGQVCSNSHDANSHNGALRYGPGIFFCTSEGSDPRSLWGHGYLLSGDGKRLPIAGDEAIDSPLFGDGVRCPSAIYSPWLLDQQTTPISVIGCPGAVSVNVEGSAYPMPFGSPEQRIVGLCLRRNPTVNLYEDIVNNLNYVKANGTIMGSAKGHSFICADSGTANATPSSTSNSFVAICCGTAGCSNLPQGAGKQYSVGMTLVIPGNEDVRRQQRTFYCMPDGSWSPDLDTHPEHTPEMATFLQGACSAARFFPSGTYCCSEGDDNPGYAFWVPGNESYNDPGGSGGCLWGTPQRNTAMWVRYPAGGKEYRSLMIKDGRFFGCNGANLYKDNMNGHILPEHAFDVSTNLATWRPTDAAYSTRSDIALVVWNSNPFGGSGGGGGAAGQFISGNGSFIGQNVVLGSDNQFTGGIKVAYDPDDDIFLVIWSTEINVYGSLVYANGTYASRSFFIAANAGVGAHASSFGNIDYNSAQRRFVVAYPRGGQVATIHGRFITPDGNVSDEFVVTTPETIGAGPSVAAGPDNLLVTWGGNIVDVGNFARLFSWNGTPLGPPIKMSNNFYATTVAFYHAGKGQYDIFYINRGIFKRTLTPDGIMSQEKLIIPETRDGIDYVGLSDMAYSPVRDSYYIVGEYKDDGGAFIEVRYDDSVSPAMVSVEDDSRPNYVPSITDVNGAPLTIVQPQYRPIKGYFGALARSVFTTDYPNPGGARNDRDHLPLASYADTCEQTTLSDSPFYCAPNGDWTSTGGRNIAHKSIVPMPLMRFFVNQTGIRTLLSVGCCQPNQCWDPKENRCIDSQQDSQDYYEVGDYAYKCLGGDWVNISGARRLTPDGCEGGFCPVEGQCLASLTGNPSQNGNVTPGANPQCINPGQYYNDNLCVNGSWSSRTNMVAIKLASLLGNDDYVISCGPANKVLVNPRQNVGLTNSWCVLDLRAGHDDSQRIFATSLNQFLMNNGSLPLGSDFSYAIQQAYLQAYPVENYPANAFLASCTMNSRDFSSSCISGTIDSFSSLKGYYDDDYQMVVFSDKPISGLTPSFGQSICNVLPSWLKWLCPAPNPFTESFRNLTFDRLYAAKIGQRGAYGTWLDGRCSCVGCDKAITFSFDYFGYSRSDLLGMLSGFEERSSNFSLEQAGAGNVSLLVKNPRGVDTWLLWDMLGFLKG